MSFANQTSDDGHWRELYGLLATACGYSYPVIDEMTLFQVEELTSYWVRHPPLHLLIGAHLGIGQNKEIPMNANSTRAGEPRSSEIGSMLSRIGPGFSVGDVHVGLSPVILYFAELARRTPRFG
jgi:hypothetical protein